MKNDQLNTCVQYKLKFAMFMQLSNLPSIIDEKTIFFRYT